MIPFLYKRGGASRVWALSGYWGRWDAAAREIRYPSRSSKGDDDDDAIPMGFGVGHPSFKAAFPESASWDK